MPGEITGSAIACCLVKACPAGNLPFADLTQATTFIDFAPCTIIILPCIATSRTVREAHAVAELRNILQHEASLLDKRGLSVWRIRQDALTVIGKMSILGFRLAEFGVNAVDGVHTWNLVCTDNSAGGGGVSSTSAPPLHQEQQQRSASTQRPKQPATYAAGNETTEHIEKSRKVAEQVSNYDDIQLATSFDIDVSKYNTETDADARVQQILPVQEDCLQQSTYNFLSTSYTDSSHAQRRSNTTAELPNNGNDDLSGFNSTSSSRSPRNAHTASDYNNVPFNKRHLASHASNGRLTAAGSMQQYDIDNVASRRSAPTMLAPIRKPRSWTASAGGSIQRTVTGQFASSSASSSSKKNSKKRKKKSGGLGRSRQRKRGSLNVGQLHPGIGSPDKTRRTNVLPDTLKALQSDELVPLLERIQQFLVSNPQLGLRPRWRLLQPLTHPHCTAHFKCTTHIKGAPVLCPARIAVGRDRDTRRYHITYEMIRHDCRQRMLTGDYGEASAVDADDAAVAEDEAEGDVAEGEDILTTLDEGGVSVNEDGVSTKATAAAAAAVAADKHGVDVSTDAAIKQDENDYDERESWTTPTVSFAVNDETPE